MLLAYVALLILLNVILLIRIDNIFTVRSLLIISYLVYYPLTFCFVYSLFGYFSLDVDLTTYVNSLNAYAMMLSTFLLIEMFSKRHRRTSSASEFDELQSHFAWDRIQTSRLLFLYLCFIAALLIRISNGIYFHISIDPNYNVSDSASYIQNSVDRLSWIGILPVFIFWLLYKFSGKKQYLAYMITLATVSVILYVPSGKRMLAIGFIPVLAIYMFATLRSIGARIAFTFVSILFMSSMIIFLGNLRVAENTNTSTQEDIGLLAERMSDFNLTGMVVERVPSEYHFRGFEGFEDIYQSAFPAVIRAQIGFPVVVENGAVYAAAIGLSPGDWSSVPLTFLGDAYSRFGWMGIVLFSAIFYSYLKLIDTKLFSRKTLFSIIAIVLFESYISQFYVSSILTNFRSMTRDFLLILLIAFVVSRFLYKPYNVRTFPGEDV